MEEMKEKVQQIIEKEIRPALQMDGGDIELVSIEGNDVHVRLHGACAGCPGAAMTLQMGVERRLKQSIPEVGRVVPVA
jgi:Fe-S cluster biogenesis protein NfuA